MLISSSAGLPPQFLSRSPNSRGGGVIQTSASECVLDCLLAARAQAIRALKVKMGDKVEETVLLSKLMAYCSKVCETKVLVNYMSQISVRHLTVSIPVAGSLYSQECNKQLIGSILISGGSFLCGEGSNDWIRKAENFGA